MSAFWCGCSRWCRLVIDGVFSSPDPANKLEVNDKKMANLFITKLASPVLVSSEQIFKKCPELRSKESLAPWAPHGVNTVRKKTFSREGVFENGASVREMFWQMWWGEMRWLWGAPRSEGMKNVMDYFHHWAEMCVHVCVCVMGMCSKLKKQGKAGTVKNSVQTGPGSVYLIPCGQVASINPPPQIACVFACAWTWTSWFVYPSAPPRRVHGGLSACDALCRNLPAYFSMRTVVCVCFLFPCFFTCSVLPLSARAGLCTGQRARGSSTWWIFNALDVPAWTFNVTPARETLLGFSLVKGRAKIGWGCVAMGKTTREEKEWSWRFLFPTELWLHLGPKDFQWPRGRAKRC